MKTIMRLCIILLAVALVHGEKIAELPEVMKPGLMDVGAGRIFITEGPTIHIYSLKDFSYIKKFGKQGEGPQEFKINPFGIPLILFEMDDHLYVSSDTKLSKFTIDGDFINETKVPPFQVFVPFQDKFVASGNSPGDNNKLFLNIGLYDKNAKFVKELYRSDTSVGPNATFNFPYSAFSFSPLGDQVYVVVGKEGFVIDAFDMEGKQVRRIKKDYSPLKVPASYRDEVDKWFKTDPNFKQFYEFFKTRLEFKSHFPPIMDMLIDGERINVITYKKKGDEYELIILDPEGKELGRRWVPIEGLVGNFMGSPIYTIDQNKYYTLIENIDEEVWELHRVDLE